MLRPARMRAAALATRVPRSSAVLRDSATKRRRPWSAPRVVETRMASKLDAARIAITRWSETCRYAASGALKISNPADTSRPTASPRPLI